MHSSTLQTLKTVFADGPLRATLRCLPSVLVTEFFYDFLNLFNIPLVIVRCRDSKSKIIDTINDAVKLAFREHSDIIIKFPVND